MGMRSTCDKLADTRADVPGWARRFRPPKITLMRLRSVHVRCCCICADARAAQPSIGQLERNCGPEDSESSNRTAPGPRARGCPFTKGWQVLAKGKAF
jgi:hypothetical protein